MGTKKSLYKAHKIKDDEFFTLYEDVANEVSLYKKQLKGEKLFAPAIGMKVITKRLFSRKKDLLVLLIYWTKAEQLKK